MSMPPLVDLALRLAAGAGLAGGAPVQRLPARRATGPTRIGAARRAHEARRPVRRQLRPGAQRARRARPASRSSSSRLDELRWIPAGQPWQKTRGAQRRRRPRGDGAAGDRRRAALRRSTASSCAGAASATRSTRCASCARPSPATNGVLILGQDQYAGAAHLARLARAGRAGHAGDRRRRRRGAGGRRRRSRSAPHQTVSAADDGRLVDRDPRAASPRASRLPGSFPPAVARYIERHHLYRRPLTGTITRS